MTSRNLFLKNLWFSGDLKPLMGDGARLCEACGSDGEAESQWQHPPDMAAAGPDPVERGLRVN